MDTRTPPIPLKHQEKKQHARKPEKNADLSLPPLAHTSNARQKSSVEKKNPGTQWTSGTPYVNRGADQSKRPYRVLHIGATPLMHACQQGDRSRVLRLLKEQEETIDYRDRTLRNALHYCMDAATGGAVASAAPELVNAPDAEGHTPLHLAVIAGDTQLVAVLLANGADVNAKDLEGHSVLHWATVCGEAECVRLVLAAGARPSTPDLRGGSPLHYAAQCCGAAVTAELSVPKKIGLKVLHTLLEFGADVNAKDEDGRQPILWAASAGSVEAVLALARAGGSAAAGATDKDGLTALHCAASRGHARCVEALVNLCGSQPDHVDDNGCSALHYAATLGHADATALLLRLGADPNRQDRKGRTPALCAAAKGQLETLKILAQHGGSLHARTVRGTGVAHEAVLSGRIELIEWLAKRKPSTLDVATHDGRTPLHVAALHGYLDACKVLIDHGARINTTFRTTKSGPMTPLDAALYRGHRDCAKLIQMHGGTTAQHVRTHRTAPNRVFAAKVKIKHGSSSPSDSESGHQKADVYIEERWIEKRTRKHSSPRKHEERRGSRSFSEEEVRLSKTSRRDRRRRAKSESSRYEGTDAEAKTCRKKHSKHEYSESSSELDSSEDAVIEARTRRYRRSESQEEERSLSDDSLEVVVVRRSVEKKSEKVQYSDRKTRRPRETSKETRVTETERRSSRKKSKEKSRSKAEEKKKKMSVLGSDERMSPTKKDEAEKKFKKDMTDSTSQETVEHVTVTALVHKDQPPETPTQPKDKKEDKPAENASTSKSKMDHILEKADEMQSALMAKAADLRKDVEDIRRQMTEEVPLGEGDEDEGVTDTGDDKLTPSKGRKDEEFESNTDDSQQEFSRLQSQPEDETSGESSSPKDADVEAKKEEVSKEEAKEDHGVDEATPEEVEVASSPDEKSVRSKRSSLSPTKGTESDKDLQSPGEKSRKSSDEKSRKSSTEKSRKSSTGKSRKSSSERTTPASHAEEKEESEDEGHDGEEENETIEPEKKENEEAAAEETQKEDEQTSQSPSRPSDDEKKKTEEIRHIDSSSVSSKSTKKSRPSTARGKSREGASSKSPTKGALFESSEERSPDRSAIVAVIESPEWDEEDEEVAKEIQNVVGDNTEADTEPDDDELGVLRVLPSTSEEETPRRPSKILKPSKLDTIPRMDRRTIGSPRLRVRTKQRRDSGGRDSGIEPSPRVSKIPKRTLKCCPNSQKQQALNMETIQRDVQISLRRYHLERKIFFQLMELKRLQIRHGKVNEHILVKRQVEAFNKSGMSGPTLGVVRYDQPLTFRDFESFLYEQLRRLQRRPATPDWCTEAKQCTQKTHRCHHATSAYTSVPIYTYLDGGGQEREEGTLLPRIESRGRGQMTVEVTKGEEKQVIALPAEKLDRTKRYFITFTVRGETQNSDILSNPRNAQRNTKSV